jgi:SAM-dependent methyltransferase
MHRNSELIFTKHARGYFPPGAAVLEIGPDGRPSTYQRIVGDGVAWATADLADSVDEAGRRLFGAGVADDVTYAMVSPYQLPVGGNSFDVVLSGQVIEHVPRIWTWMAELTRVCRPGGHVITIGPLSWPYHEAPVDCWRIYPEGMRALCAAAGLEVVHSEAECLESPQPRRAYPGAHLGRGTKPRAALRRWAGWLGWPLPIAVDTITIARKPLPTHER